MDAVGDMVDRTSTEIAPLDPGRSQRQALRPGQVLRTINDAIEAAYKKDK